MLPFKKTFDNLIYLRNCCRYFYNIVFNIEGAFCDLVWSDPEEVETWSVSPRGAGWIFGAKVTHEFMDVNKLKLICRAHQLVHEGML